MIYTLRESETCGPVNRRWTILPSIPGSQQGLSGSVIGNRLHEVSSDVLSQGTRGQVHRDSVDAFGLDGETR